MEENDPEKWDEIEEMEARLEGRRKQRVGVVAVWISGGMSSDICHTMG